MTSNSTFDKQTQYRGHRGKTGLDIKYILFISTDPHKQNCQVLLLNTVPTQTMEPLLNNFDDNLSRIIRHRTTSSGIESACFWLLVL